MKVWLLATVVLRFQMLVTSLLQDGNTPCAAGSGKPLLKDSGHTMPMKATNGDVKLTGQAKQAKALLSVLVLAEHRLSEGIAETAFIRMPLLPREHGRILDTALQMALATIRITSLNTDST